MANLLDFKENDMLGRVTHVDTEQIIIEIENATVMNKIWKLRKHRELFLWWVFRCDD